MKFPKEFMLDILYGESDEAELISDKIIYNSRWTIVHTIIFKHKDSFYKAYYNVGATEYQEESPWEDDEKVECTEVVPVEKTIITYVAKGEINGA